ncbi:hypothetical protein Q2T40_19300 [Winogradskyella maritima]|uniref:LPXTG-motif cell wall-anchored protein n=1 Tax=Winogradskyella maritima TaxID=1517766 RepID=A0ABV8AEK9_9FLAO|nr:hypothetical protein [Winogradskyella maritima]
MKFIDYVTGQGGLMLLGLIVVLVLLIRKYKEKRYFKHIEKSDKIKKESDSKS